MDNKIRVTVDRIEGDWLVMIPEDGPIFQMPLSLFPEFKEGEIILISFTRDEQGEKDVKKRVDEIRKGLNRTELC